MHTTDNGDGTYTHTCTGQDGLLFGMAFAEGIAAGIFAHQRALQPTWRSVQAAQRDDLWRSIMRVCAGQQRRQMRARHRPA